MFGAGEAFRRAITQGEAKKKGGRNSDGTAVFEMQIEPADVATLSILLWPSVDRGKLFGGRGIAPDERGVLAVAIAFVWTAPVPCHAKEFGARKPHGHTKTGGF